MYRDLALANHNYTLDFKICTKTVLIDAGPLIAN